MLEKIPTSEELKKLLGADKYNAWTAACALVDSLYEMDILWNTGGKAWMYEYKYRRGGKTLCALYARENGFGLLIIFGKAEREKFENEQSAYSPIIQNIYHSSTTYHDGKWMMIEEPGLTLLDDIKKLLQIKRKPNRK
jgi:hypothetical protein